ncbi:MFS transporter [Actinomycetospora termitidis]|uniref:MFS transporter n=1 Tax=Actinomycetospora termitidis TaxID=3053470 RepID=A0ABT7M6G0_9PSEU|nr:MFS transporter [Actinomycetospora sp. Odt1-22]MDL5156263.1 MFS transporter [Actinomycetospora sp. Odt1-22]
MSSAPAAPAGAQPARAALAAWIGSALEYYDFFIYGTAAALVFSKVFFPSSSPTAGTLLALATFGVGYVARPLGAVVLGHVGDRVGRRRVLIFTLILMGASTFAIGCLPDYATAGAVGPALLVTCRLLQGFSAGGEQAGANSMTLEHAPDDRRAFFSSFTLGGTQAGMIIATLVFLPIAALPEDALLSWGWRVPFWLSVVVVAAGIVIRRTLSETPVFEQERSRGRTEGLPIVALLRDHWAAVLRVVLAALVSSVSTLVSVWALSYATSTQGLDRATMLWVSVAANVVALAAIPLFARYADRTGRKPVFVFGCVASAVLLACYLWSISTASYALVFVFGILLSGVVYSAANGVWPAFYGEMFPARVRLTGMAVGTQIGFAVGGFVPTIAEALVGKGAGGWVPVAVLGAGLCLLAAVAALTATETAHVPTADLDRVADHGTPAATPAAV